MVVCDIRANKETKKAICKDALYLHNYIEHQKLHPAEQIHPFVYPAEFHNRVKALIKWNDLSLSPAQSRRGRSQLVAPDTTLGFPAPWTADPLLPTRALNRLTEATAHWVGTPEYTNFIRNLEKPASLVQSIEKVTPPPRRSQSLDQGTESR